MKTLKEQLLDKIRNLSDRQFKNFVFDWFGGENLFDMLEESIESNEKETIKDGLSMLK